MGWSSMGSSSSGWSSWESTRGGTFGGSEAPSTPSRGKHYGPVPAAIHDAAIDPVMLKAGSIAERRAQPHSTLLCWRYVKEALVAAGSVDSYPQSSFAKGRRQRTREQIRLRQARRTQCRPRPGRFGHRLRRKWRGPCGIADVGGIRQRLSLQPSQRTPLPWRLHAPGEASQGRPDGPRRQRDEFRIVGGATGRRVGSVSIHGQFLAKKRWCSAIDQRDNHSLPHATSAHVRPHRQTDPFPACVPARCGHHPCPALPGSDAARVWCCRQGGCGARGHPTPIAGHRGPTWD